MRQMLVFRYVKTDGYQFVSHLDVLRHIQKTFIRGEIPVEYSQGFNPHMLIFLSNPLGVGIKSEAEYGVTATSLSADEFIKRYNENCPQGIRCVNAFSVEKNPNLAAIIDSARYVMKGLSEKVDLEKILASDCFLMTDKKGNEKNVRDKIISLKREGKNLVAVLKSGAENLRPDLFSAKLESLYGFEFEDVVKTASFIDGRTPEEVLK